VSLRRRSLFPLVRHVVLLAWTVVTLFPIYWMVMTSFKHAGEWVTWPPRWLPHEPTLVNYVKILTPGTSTFELGRQTLKVLKPIGDSLIVSGIGSLLAVVLGSALAYSWSRFGTGGRNYPYNILSIRMVPPIVIAVPFVVYFVTLRLLDTYTGLILVYTATCLPYVIWMMLAFVDEVPIELERAARLMGASRLRVLRSVVLPLTASGLVVTFLFVFILNWSELLLAITLTNTEVSTLPITLNKFQSANEGRDYGPQAAIGTLATLPVVVMGFLIQKHLLRGFSFGLLRK
jgi:multiple sugar transport system permease protein